ncbi:hypothetical protein Lfu02_70670 [Longispora fulva]|uniref:Uncharacterized protein n=1 Tax=Longispora fulva TaxID=619741 RepID=A0A8J7KG04_9ACTN|nr:hypothetical protein [Longispora fulva]MBG6134389.1 hypothetical protein [Longispora fulva]GIG62695.1 hypothetical protein Lfu02_70670 [Longispora fulva]
MRRAVVLVVLLALTTGCFGGLGGYPKPADLTPEGLVGVWRTSDGGRAVEFTAEGDFYATDVGFMFLDFDGGRLANGTDLRREKVSGSGQWALDPAGDRTGAPVSRVGLHFDALGGGAHRAAMEIHAQWSDSGIALVHYVGDPDSNDTISYVKCAANCPNPAEGHPVPGERIGATAGQMAGTWRDVEHGGSITLDKDGRFRGSDFSYQFDVRWFGPGVLPGTGTWSVERPPGDRAGALAGIRLLFGEVAGHAVHGDNRTMRVYRIGEVMALVSVTSDPTVNPRFVYMRCGECG